MSATGRSMLPAVRALRAMADGEAPPALDAFTQNDSTLVVEWVQREGHALRKDYALDAWWTFQGHAWRLDRDGAVQRSLQSYLEYRLHEALLIDNRADRDAAVRFITRQLRAGHLPRLLDHAAHQHRVAVAGDQWDTQPLLLACPNGVLDLERRDQRDGDPADTLTKVTAVDYDPTAAAPRWTTFILDICSGDPDRAEYLRRFLGYCLTGCTDEQVFLVAHGHGANGKSTLVNTIVQHVIPEHAWSMAFPTSGWSESLSEYQRASLAGRRLVVAQETENGKRLNVEFIKSLTGGDLVNARHPYGRPFTYRPQAKLFLCVNHRPVIHDDGHGMWRRVRLVPFEQTFPVNPDFPKGLLEELPGILNWMVGGAFAWMREGLCTPTSVLEATDAYRKDSDHFNAFTDDRCWVDEPAMVRASLLYEAYRHWCDANSVKDVERYSQKAFGQRVRRDFAAIEGRQVTFRGVGLRDGGVE